MGRHRYRHGRAVAPAVGVNAQPKERLRWSELPAVALLVVVALWIRFPGLSTHNLYRDDAWPALAIKTGLGQTVRMGVTTPGFEVFLRTWLGVSRSTPWAQAPALVASLAAVAAVYALARWLGCGRAAALLAAGILTLSPINVLYATRVKPYSLDALGTIALLAMAVAVSRQPASVKRWAGLLALSVATAVFSASTLPVSVSAVAWSAVVAIRQGDRRARRLSLGVPSAYLAFLAVYASVVLGSVPPSLREAWTENYIYASGAGQLVRTTATVTDTFVAGIFYRTWPTGAVMLAVLVLMALWHRPRIAVLVVAPVVVALGLALLQRAPFGGGRIDIYLYPCVALLTAMAAQKVLDLGAGRIVPARVAEVALVVAVAVLAATNGREHMRGNPYPAADMGPLTAAVRARMLPGDAMVVGAFSRYPFALYAARRPEVVLSPLYAPGFTVRSGEPDVYNMPAEFFEDGYDPDEAVRFAEGRSRVWYLATDTPPSDTPPAVQAFEYEPEQRLIDAGFRATERIDAYGVHADLLVRP